MNISAVYSIANRDLSIFDSKGNCICIAPCNNIKDAMNKYGLKDEDIMISF